MKNKQDEGIDLETFNVEQEILKFKNLKLSGWNIAVRLYTAPQKLGNLYIPDSIRSEDQYKNCVGFVVGMSKGAYQDEHRYKYTGAYCKLGDCVLFPMHSGFKISYYGAPLFILNEDVISAVLADPINDIPQISK